MKSLILLPLIFLMSNPARAYFEMRREAVNPKVAIAQSKKLGFSISNLESANKEEMKTWKTKKVTEQLDSPAPESLLLEVKEDQKKIETAKLIARFEVYTAIKKNWKVISQTPINENAFSENEWDKFVPYLKRKLMTMRYEKTKDPNNYFFTFDDGNVRVSRDLKMATRTIETAHVDDGNELDQGVNKLRLPDQKSSPSRGKTDSSKLE